MAFRTVVFGDFVCCCLAVCLHTGIVNAAPPTVEQVQQALDIAELSARNQLVDLSLTAVQRALQSGPPTVSTKTPPPSVQTQGSRIDISQPAQISPVRIVRTRIPQTIRRLSESWNGHADPQRVYETLRSVVLPPNRPNEVFLYPAGGSAKSGAGLPSAYSVGHELIRAAALAKSLPETVRAIQSRGLDHSADAMLLLLLCALETQDANGVSKYSERLGKIVSAGCTPDTVRLAANAGGLVRRRTDDSQAAAQILYAAAKTSLTISRYDSDTSFGSTTIAMEGVRSSFAAGHDANAIELLKLCLAGEELRQQRSQSTGALGRIREVVASELYGRGLVGTARELLGVATAAEFESRYLNPLLLSADGSAPERLIPAVAVATQARVLPFTGNVVADDVEQQVWICSLDTDTNQSTILFTLPDFQNVSFPVVSPDGQQLAFAATFPGQVVTSDSRIYIVPLTGTSIRELGRGTLPSWSPEGRRLVCSRYSPDRGVWLMRVDTASVRLLDENGWAGRWSPDGSRIAYIRAGGNGTDFVVADFVEDTSFRIATGRRTSTAQSSWNFCWTPDGKGVIVEALSKGRSEEFAQTLLAAVGGTGNPDMIHKADYFNVDLIPWPQRSAVLIAPMLKKYGAERLHRSSNAGTGLTYLPGQFDDRRNSGASWLPDGRTLIYLSRQERR